MKEIAILLVQKLYAGRFVIFSVYKLDNVKLVWISFLKVNLKDGGVQPNIYIFESTRILTIRDSDTTPIPTLTSIVHHGVNYHIVVLIK